MKRLDAEIAGNRHEMDPRQNQFMAFDNTVDKKYNIIII